MPFVSKWNILVLFRYPMRAIPFQLNTYNKTDTSSVADITEPWKNIISLKEA